MRAPAIHTARADVATRDAARTRIINPVTGYGLAVVVSVAFWGLLLAAIF